mmetsp:Transcript_19629/g.30181  ORF Transcript_19629/g.30181 Transcript_19629/m.30181 type:complete len:556 (+) Transcript_19629:319-1986(+)
MIDSSEAYRILQSDSWYAAFKYIDDNLPFQQHTCITNDPTPKDILQFEREVQINARAIKTTLGGGQHGYLGITLSASRYTCFSNTPFPDDCPEGSDDSKTGTMNDVERTVLVLVRGILLRKIYSSVHPDFHYCNEVNPSMSYGPIHEHLANIRDTFRCNLSREEREHLATKDRYWYRTWMHLPTSFELQAQSTPTSFKVYGDSAFTSTSVDNNSATNQPNNTSTLVTNDFKLTTTTEGVTDKPNSAATAADNEAAVVPVQANTTIINCTTLPTESQPSVNPEYHQSIIKGKGKSCDQRHHELKHYFQQLLRNKLDSQPSTNAESQRNIIKGKVKSFDQRYVEVKQQIQQFREQLDRSDEKLQLLRQRLRTPPATPSVKPNNNNQFSSPSTNNTATERDMKRTEYRNIKGKGSTKYDKRKGACNNNPGAESEIYNQTTTATQQYSAVHMATKQHDRVPRVKSKEDQQLPKEQIKIKLERNASVPRVIEKHESSVEQQQHKSDSMNKSIQQQLPPILHDNKLPVVKKLDGKAGKAEKWQIACENGFGRMIPATVPVI